MRIISKYKDYYDGLSERNKKDRLIRVWVRKEKIIPLHKEILDKFDYQYPFFGYGWDQRWHQGFLIISGKVFPFVKHYKTSFDIDENSIDYFFDLETLEKKCPYVFEKTFGKRDVVNFFKEYPDMTDICLNLKSPIVLIEPHEHYSRNKDYNTFNVKINPPLKYMDFGRVLSAFEVYQSLDYFISNVLVDDETPKPKQTDKDKILAHGFDYKESFRKRKKK